jgi:integrase
MDDVAQHPGLVRRKARYYLRARIPQDLVTFLGRAELWRSLRTGDHREAVKLFRRARADLDTWFEAQRRRRDAGERLNGEAPRLVANWFHQAERRAAHLDFDLVGDVLHMARAEADQELVDLLEGAAGEDVAAAVDQILIANGWPARAHQVGVIQARRTKVADVADAAPPGALGGLVRRALVEAARRRLDRLRGRPGAAYDPMFDGSVQVQPGAKENGQDGGISLAELIERFAAEKGPRVRAKKMLEYGMLFRALKELWGDHRPIREIRPEDCQRVRDLFSTLPANSIKRWPKLTLVQAAEHARQNAIAPMRPTTANAYLGRLSTMFKWAVRRWLIERNPAEALTVAEPEGDPRAARDPFTLDQLRKIFSAPLYTGCKDDERGYAVPGPNVTRRARFWLPLLGLFTGARMNEICQLGVDDVTTEHGVHVVRVLDDPETGKRVKTEAARRVVPIHAELKRIGFLEFVARQRKAGHDRLFPELKQDRRGYYSEEFQKWFNDRGRFLEKTGAKAPKTSFHSFRHTFTDALRRAGATGEVIDGMCGWSRDNMRDRYGSGPWIMMLAEVMQRVEYDLDLSYLRTR